MYESFFRFSERPFAVLPDASRLFWTDGHRNAFSALEVGLDRLSQVTVLTGGIGTGKTTLIRHLLQTTSSDYSVGLLSNFAGDRCDLLPWALSAFGLDVSGSSEAVKFNRLQKFVAGELDRGRRSVLIVDEAQNLSVRDLESLRLLSNVNCDTVLMMLVLVGQPQLRAKLTHVDNQRLCHRIGADYHLEPLSRQETPRFVRHRCVQAGGSPGIFDDEALDEVHRISGGVPRKINVLCDLALVTAYAEGIRQVGYRIVRSVVEDARRHGTYMSLTEGDDQPAETAAAIGPATRPAPASPDPAHRLALKLESRDASTGTGLLGPRIDDHVPPLRAGSEAEPSAPADSSVLNAVFNMAWPDDTLMFVHDPARPARETAFPPAAEPTPSEEGERAPDGPQTPPADSAETDAPAAVPGDEAGGGGAATRQAPAPGARTLFHQRPAASPDSPEASALPASGAERALRQAFAPRQGRRPTGRRIAKFGALAAGGSMAAAIAIAVLPGGTPLPTVMDAAGEARSDVPEHPDALGAGSFPVLKVQAATADPAAGTGRPVAAAPQGRPSARQETAIAELPVGPEEWAQFTPVALAGPNPAADTPSLAAEGTALPRPKTGTAGARPSAPARAKSDSSMPLQGPAHHGPGRLSQPPAPRSPDRLAETTPFVGPMPADTGSPMRPAPEGRLAFVAPGAAVPALPAAAAAPATPAGRTGDRRSRALPPSAEPPLHQPSSASSVPTDRATPARLAAPALTAASPRIPPAEGLAAVSPATASPAGAAVALPLNIVASGSSSDSDAEKVFRRAIEIAVEDSRAAVIAYSRAALMGHERAAYYLGQIYETGDGVPIDLAIARHWYEAASDGNPRAENRMADLPRPEGGDMDAPLPLLAQSLDAGRADFVWSSGEGADPFSYIIEIGAGAGTGVVAAYPVVGSAARLPLVEGATHWRVIALDNTGGPGAASDWRVVKPAGAERSAAADAPPGQL